MTILNECDSMGGLLESIDRQTRQPDEFVICDAGSTDGTLQVIEQWIASTSIPTRVIVAEGANIAQGRNLAIRSTTSDVLAVTDGGCVLDQQWLERLADSIARDDIDVVFGGSRAQGVTTVGRTFAHLYNAKTHTGNLTNTEHSSRSVAFRRHVWDAVGGYPEYLTLAGEDAAFFAALQRSHRIVVQRDAFVTWHHGTDSLRSIYQVHRRNARGEGEAMMWPSRFVALTLGYLCAMAVLFWPRSPTRSRVTGALLLLVYNSRASHRVARVSGGWRNCLALPLVSLVRDAGMSVGYIEGLWSRRTTAPARVGKEHSGQPEREANLRLLSIRRESA